MEHILDRLLTERLVQDALLKLHEAQWNAEKASYRLLQMPLMPMLDADINKMFDERQKLRNNMGLANHFQRHLERTVQFYLNTY